MEIKCQCSCPLRMDFNYWIDLGPYYFYQVSSVVLYLVRLHPCTVVIIKISFVCLFFHGNGLPELHFTIFNL